jgi:hypothetical protein
MIQWHEGFNIISPSADYRDSQIRCARAAIALGASWHDQFVWSMRVVEQRLRWHVLAGCGGPLPTTKVAVRKLLN